MKCNNNIYKCLTDGMGVIMFVPLTTTTTTSPFQCRIVDCEGTELVDCECNVIICNECVSDCYIVDCEDNYIIDCFGDYLSCVICPDTTSTTSSTTSSTTTTIPTPSEGGDFSPEDFSSTDFYTDGILNPLV
jgi:hypothetical protein